MKSLRHYKDVFARYSIKGVQKKVSFELNSLILGVMRKIVPVNDAYIVLESEGDYTDNAKVFYDYLIANDYHKKYRIIWIVHEPQKYDAPENVYFVSRWNFLNLKADYYAACAGIFIFTHPYWLQNWRKEQLVIGTSHAVAQLKAGSESQKKKMFDYVLCCSDYCSEVRQKVFHIPKEKTVCVGMPRIDLLYQDNNYVRELLPYYHGQKILLSMETFKQAKNWKDSNVNADPYAINVVHSAEQLHQLDTWLAEKNMLYVVKIHHLQDMSFLKTEKLQNILYLSDDFLAAHNITVNQLLYIADVLFTDYSSVFYEYLLMDRPIGFLIGDIDSYSRGFLMDDPFQEMPGKKIQDFDALLEFLDDCANGTDFYKTDRETIRRKVFKYDNQENCKRLMDWIEQKKEAMNRGVEK